LTDFLLAENLKLAYENRQAANALAQGDAAPPPPPAAQDAAVPMSPEVKQAIADEVRQQLEAQQAAAAQQPVAAQQMASQPANLPVDQQAPPPALDPKVRTFIVSSNLNLDVGGQACALSPGDILVRTSDSLVQNTKVSVMVLSSQAGDCPSGSSTGLMEVADLQEMHNQFSAQIGAGLQTLAQNQGQNGLPASPAPNPTPVVEGTATPDANVGNLLAKDESDANQAVQEVQQETS
jgi:hypothetical protein